MAASLVATAAPPAGPAVIGSFAPRQALLERNRLVFRRGWMVIFSGFFEPLFYLLGIGFGLGTLDRRRDRADGRRSRTPCSSRRRCWPQRMNGAVYDSTNMFFRLRYEKAYDGMLATPMNVGDIALGEIVWALVRGALYGLASWS